MENVRKQDVIQKASVIAEAHLILGRIPERHCCEKTRRTYLRTFKRMCDESNFDPLRAGDSRDTYSVRRAALHYGARRTLVRLLEKIDAYANSSHPQYQEVYEKFLKLLGVFVAALGPAIERDPPMVGDTPDFKKESRWKAQAGTKKRGAGSKKYVLADLPRDWIVRFWDCVPADHKYRDAVAVLCVSPARAGEVVPGDRPSGFCEGVHVTVDAEGCLVLTHAPQKTHGGKYGMSEAGVRIEPAKEGKCALYLVQRCEAEGGEFVVAAKSPDALRKAITNIGQKAFPDGPAITPNVLRSQRIADMKKAFGAGEKVASGAGHSTDRTQAKYGNVAHGRKGGLKDTFGSRKPRVGAVDRARNLGLQRKAHPVPSGPR